MIRVLLAIFGFCPHRHISWPQTKGGATTVQCHDCHRSVAYDWAEMRIVQRQQTPRGEGAEVLRG